MMQRTKRSHLMRTMNRICAVFSLGLLSSTALYAQPQAQNPSAADSNEDVFFRNIPGARRYAVIITGPGASEEITDRLWQWSLSLHDVLARDYGYGEDTITLLIDDGGEGPMSGSRVDGSSRHADIEAGLSSLRERTNPGDQVSIFLLGHGSGEAEEAKFNIVGPDITGLEFAALLEPFNQQDLIVFNTTSSSYEFARALSARGRVIVSATRSRAERYDPMFANYLIEALNGRAGDRDKNNRVSVLEAFTYAGTSVQGWYREQGRLPTERAVLDDNGDGVFNIEPAPGGGDGGLAEIAYLDVPRADATKVSPEAQQLMVEMQDLERSVFLLRGQKTNYLEDDYWERMETLLIELARKSGRYHELP